MKTLFTTLTLLFISIGAYSQGIVTLTMQQKPQCPDLYITVFPNPTQGIFNITINETISTPINIDIDIYDIYGRVVLSKQIKNPEIKKPIILNASHLQKANYFLKVRTINILSNQIIIIN